MSQAADGQGRPAPDPMPSWVEPQLAMLTNERFSSPEWVFERKLDGERCLAFAGRDGVRLMSRNEHDTTATFPEIAAAVATQHHGNVILDGEIVAFEGLATRFERLQHRLGVAHPDAELVRSIPVIYYVFDVLYANGGDARALPLLERKRLLADAVTFEDPLRFTSTARATGWPSISRRASTAGRGWSPNVRMPPTCL